MSAPDHSGTLSFEGGTGLDVNAWRPGTLELWVAWYGADDHRLWHVVSLLGRDAQDQYSTLAKELFLRGHHPEAAELEFRPGLLANAEWVRDEQDAERLAGLIHMPWTTADDLALWDSLLTQHLADLTARAYAELNRLNARTDAREQRSRIVFSPAQAANDMWAYGEDHLVVRAADLTRSELEPLWERAYELASLEPADLPYPTKPPVRVLCALACIEYFEGIRRPLARKRRRPEKLTPPHLTDPAPWPAE